VRLFAVFISFVTFVALSACAAGPSPKSTPSPSPTPSTAPAPDAAAILAKLTAAKAVSAGVVQDADTDPNHLLGRPGGYLSRASFDLPGGDTAAKPGEADRGGVLEVFPTVDGAKRRADYIGGIASKAPELATEYDFVHGAVLLRVARGVNPQTAKKVDAAVAAAIGG
jgi:hypothetical protein